MTSMIKYDKYDQVWPSMTPYGHSSSQRTIRQKYQVWQVWPSMTPYGHSSSQRTKRLKVPSITSKLNMTRSSTSHTKWYNSDNSQKFRPIFPHFCDCCQYIVEIY